jgi:hypothetical protein
MLLRRRLLRPAACLAQLHQLCGHVLLRLAQHAHELRRMPCILRREERVRRARRAGAPRAPDAVDVVLDLRRGQG